MDERKLKAGIAELLAVVEEYNLTIDDVRTALRPAREEKVSPLKSVSLARPQRAVAD